VIGFSISLLYCPWAVPFACEPEAVVLVPTVMAMESDEPGSPLFACNKYNNNQIILNFIHKYPARRWETRAAFEHHNLN
jgi:hypothetical protein